MWRNYRVAAAAAAVSDLSITIDPYFLGGSSRWRAQEMDAAVVRYSKTPQSQSKPSSQNPYPKTLIPEP